MMSKEHYSAREQLIRDADAFHRTYGGDLHLMSRLPSEDGFTLYTSVDWAHLKELVNTMALPRAIHTTQSMPEPKGEDREAIGSNASSLPLEYVSRVAMQAPSEHHQHPPVSHHMRTHHHLMRVQQFAPQPEHTAQSYGTYGPGHPGSGQHTAIGAYCSPTTQWAPSMMSNGPRLETHQRPQMPGMQPAPSVPSLPPLHPLHPPVAGPFFQRLTSHTCHGGPYCECIARGARTGGRRTLSMR
ncbi:hypothetical protein F5Y18DRAFT_386824 [Xylariaceae sp. FL1019]|nr:hypothetical protein F5Y18DRAFT_386824 [Xylariaceae sp. FL1019]